MASVKSPSRLPRLAIKTSASTSDLNEPYYTPKHSNGQQSRNQTGILENGGKMTEDYFATDSRPFAIGSKFPGTRYAGGSFSIVDEDDQIPTPPVDIPQPSADILGPFLEESDQPHNSRYAEPSPLELFIRQRNTSIDFSPQVTLDSGHKHGLNEPLPKDIIRPRIIEQSLLGVLPSDSSRVGVVDDLDASEWTDCGSAKDYLKGHLKAVSEGAHRDQTHSERPERPFLSAVAMETAGCRDHAEVEPIASLTSESTASSVSHEVRTPIGSPSEYTSSPISAFLPLRQPTSFQESSAWPAPRRHGSSRPKSYASDRSAGLRNGRRRSSLRSSSTTSMSPASAFLSMWGKEEASAQPDDEGQEVGDYVLGKQIGFGGFSVVREAYTIEDGERVQRAVKIVRKQVSGKEDRENEQLQAEFEHEVGLWRCLINCHILPLVAVYETNFATFCFTPLITGGTLFDVVRSNRKGLDGKQARRYTYQLAEAVRYLHEDVRVVHRDIKLENCLVDRSSPDDAAEGGNVLLCDFGMAEFITSDTRSNSPDPYENASDRPPSKSIGPSETSTSIIGSLQYASPELVAGPAGLLKTSVDIWAFGVVVYALLVGNLPFNHPLPSKVQKMISTGDWSEAALSQAHGVKDNVQDALDLLRGCLELESDARWDVSQVLGCRWLRGCRELYGEVDSGWSR